MPVRPMLSMLLDRMVLVSFRLFCKNLGNLQEFFRQMVYRPPPPPPPPPRPKIARTPMKRHILDVAFFFKISFYCREYICTQLSVHHGCLPFDRKIRLGCWKHNGKQFASLLKNCHIRYGLNPKRGRICVA